MIDPIILNTNGIISKLYHISDIHIRRYDRQVEYAHVFNNLYEYLKTVANKNSLIVITGDIFHAKDNLTPDCIINTYGFLKSLSNIMPVIMILGNHDMVETNKTIKDSISAIMAEHEINNLYYLRDTGAYRYNNIIFGVSSLYDGEFIKSNNIIKNKHDTLVGLYHGPVGACSTSVGVILHGDKKITDFDGYDYVLLGDIHKYQFLAPNMAYSSSLISQNFAETDKYHGVLIWDLLNKQTEYKIIDNPYRHLSANIITGLMIVDDIEIDYKLFDFPSHAKIRLNVSGTNREECDKIKKIIRKRFPNIVFYETFIDINKTTIDTTDVKKIDMFELLLKYTNKLEPEELDECKSVFNSKLNETNLSNEKSFFQWELLDLEFSNLFAYGENNKVDFKKLPFNDIVGIFAPNSHGKSSLIDILLFSLYENFSRNVESRYRSIPSYIINNTKKWCETKIRFKLGDDIYTIHKKGILKGKNTTKTGKTIDFIINTFIKENNGTINLTRKDRFETQKEINNIIGTYDDFCLTTLFLQNKEKNFYDMKPVERKEFLYNLLKLDQFEKMYDFFKTEERITKIKLDDTKERLNGIDIDIVVDNIIDYKKQLKKTVKCKEKILLIKEKYNNKRQKLVKLLNNDQSILKSDLLDINLNSDDIDRLKINLDICNLIIDNIKPIQNNNDILLLINSHYPYTQYNSLYSEDKINHIYESNYELENIIKYKDFIEEKYNIYIKLKEKYTLLKYKYEIVCKQIEENAINNNCKICLKRKNILDNYILEKNNIITEMKDIELFDYNINHICLLLNDTNIESIRNYIISKSEEHAINKIKIDTFMINFINEIKYYYMDKMKATEEEEIYKKIRNYIEYLKINIKFLENNQVIKKLNKIETKIIYIDSKLNDYNNTHSQISYELAKYEEQFKQYNSMKTDMNEYQKKHNIVNALKKATHINGIPSKIISTRLSDIEEKVNLLISPFIKKKGDFFPAITGIIIAFEFISVVGVWYMKKWGFRVYLTTAILNQCVLL